MQTAEEPPSGTFLQPWIQEVSKFKVNVGQIQGSGQLGLDNKNLSQ